MLDRAGEIAIAGVFVAGGWDAFRDPGGRPSKAASLGIPMPKAAVRANGLAMAAGGVALGAGVLRRAAATGLICSLIPTTFAGHAFWKEKDPAVRAQQRTQFLKNFGLIGGLLLVAGRPSRRERRRG